MCLKKVVVRNYLGFWINVVNVVLIMIICDSF